MVECGKPRRNRFDGHFHAISKPDRGKSVCHIKPDNTSAGRRYAVNKHDGGFTVLATDHDSFPAGQVSERDCDAALSNMVLNTCVTRIEGKEDSPIDRKIVRNLQAVSILCI